METVIISDDFSPASLEVGDVIWYKNDDISHPTPDPHPHIIIAIDGGFLYTVCGTSKEDTIKRKIQNFSLDYSLFPAFGSEQGNSLTSDTYFDCYTVYEIHQHDLEDKYQNGEIVNSRGKIKYSQYEQIRSALKSSATLDIEDLLIHPNDDEPTF